MLRNLNILGTVFAEHEAKPPLLVDADAVLSSTISRKRFKPIARENLQILQAHRRIELLNEYHYY
jgi:hypothetical protein